MSATEESLVLLRRIAVAVEKLAAGQSGGVATGAAIADDADLDSRWGDEEVKLSPRDWTGEPMKGRHMSECPPEFLEMLASMADYFAEKNEKSGKVSAKGNPVAPYDRKTAARARGWAARKRNGWKPAGSTGNYGTTGAGSSLKHTGDVADARGKGDAWEGDSWGSGTEAEAEAQASAFDEVGF